MTLIAALRCRDALILGSDSQETRGRPGHRLARQTIKIYEPRPGFLIAWSGFQDVAQAFALRLERATDLTPERDRADLKSRLHELVADVRTDKTLEDRPELAEFFVAWHSVPDRKAVGVHLRGVVSGEWIASWASGGTRTAAEIAGWAIGTLRYIDPLTLTREQAKILALKVLRDTISTGVEGVGGRVQLGSVSASGLEVMSPAQIRGLHNTLDLWEAQMAELLPGSVAVPADSATPDRGVGPPS